MLATYTNNAGLTLHTPAEAAKIADALNADAEAVSDGWTYSVETYPSGWSVVVVIDEDGREVGTL